MAGVVRNVSLHLQRNTQTAGILRLCSTSTVTETSKRTKNKTALSAYKRGRGGRSSFNGIVATVFGASGFLGRYVVNQLGKIGTQVVLPYRGPEYDVEHLKLCGDLGQILYTSYNLRDEASIRKAMQYSNVVINLVGRDWQTRNFSFNDVHVDGAELIARIAAEQGVEKLIHLSAMNASEEPEATVFNKSSQFLSSKVKKPKKNTKTERGEQAVRRQFPEAIIMRPADMWGDEDRFFQYWCTHWRKHFECLPLWNKGELTVKQPVDVANVAQGIIKAMLDKDTDGATFECVGPKSYYLADMLDFFYDEMRYGPPQYIPILPSFIAKVKFCEKVYPATPPLIYDKLLREAVSDRLTGCPTLEDLGVELNPLEDAARYQLKVRRQHRYYHESLGEIASAPDPPTAAEVDQSRKAYY